MPGAGVDPYAALAGMISQGPVPGGGPPGMGGMDPGMMGIDPAMGQGMPPGMGGMPGMDGDADDPMLQALLAGSDPQMNGQGQGQAQLPPGMSIDQLIQMLALAQGGIPSSGVGMGGGGGSGASGLPPFPAGMGA
jgi:hypothetical protein